MGKVREYLITVIVFLIILFTMLIAGLDTDSLIFLAKLQLVFLGFKVIGDLIGLLLKTTKTDKDE